MQSIYSVIWLNIEKIGYCISKNRRQNLNNSWYQKFDKEGSDLISALSLVEFFQTKQG